LRARAGFEERKENVGTGLPKWREYKDIYEKSYIEKLRLLSENNVSKACRISGLSRTRLYQLINKYDVLFS
jgi:two-component system NtrC family response regulator